VTDDWIKDLHVEKVAGGGIPTPMSRAELDAVLAQIPVCCRGGLGRCCDTDKSVWPLPPEWAAVRPFRLEFAHASEGETTLVRAGR
jgi:hypothetical protein